MISTTTKLTIALLCATFLSQAAQPAMASKVYITAEEAKDCLIAGIMTPYLEGSNNDLSDNDFRKIIASYNSCLIKAQPNIALLDNGNIMSCLVEDVDTVGGFSERRSSWSDLKQFSILEANCLNQKIQERINRIVGE